MPHRIRLVSLALASALAVLALPAAAPAAQEQRVGGAQGPAAVPDRVIVVWEDGAERSQRAEARDDAETDLVRTLGDAQFQLLETEPGQSVGDALASLRDDPAVRSAAPDTLWKLHATTNDPLFGQLWGLQNLGLGIDGFSGALWDADIDVQRAWNRTRGIPGVVIAIIDSGYRFDHPDLAPVTWSNPADPQNGLDDDRNGIVDDWRGADFVGASLDSPSRDGDPTDDDVFGGGHGTHVAGTAAAAGNNGVGVSGVAQNARIMPLRVCSYRPSTGDSGLCSTSAQIEAINYAGSHGARVANMSLGGVSRTDAVRDALASNPRTLYVVSAANDGQDNEAVPHYPCNFNPVDSGIPGAIDNVVCVAATDQADELASFSDWGARSVDLGAPGTEILSTYMWDRHVDETFSVDDFAAKWTATGANGGFARTSEAPLTSFGMSDSPGAAPAPGSVRETTSAAVTLPAGYSNCRIQQRRTISLGGGTYTYEVLLNGTPIARSSPSTSGLFFLDITSGLSGGGSLQLRFRYTAGGAPTSANGVWLDDVSFRCPEPAGQADSYGFLDGTSMAAPHVSGAAGLLFSLKPTATVTEVKDALLDSVDPLDSLDGITVTGGALNAADALEALVPGGVIPPPDTAITSAPTSGTTSTTATFSFARTDELDFPLFECKLDGGAFQACTPGVSYPVGGGAHTFAVRAVDEFGTADPTPASTSWTVVAPPPAPPGPPVLNPPVARPSAVRCVVPRLAGLSLARARAALLRARCRLGRVTRPRARRGRRLPPLVVRSSRPAAGTSLAENASVAVTLKAAPPRRARRRARRR